MSIIVEKLRGNKIMNHRAKISEMLGIPLEDIQRLCNKYAFQYRNTERLYNLVVKLKQFERMGGWYGLPSSLPLLKLSTRALEMLACSCIDYNQNRLDPFLEDNPDILFKKIDNYENTGIHYLCLMGRLDLIEKYMKIELEYLGEVLAKPNYVLLNGGGFTMLSGQKEAVKKMYGTRIFNVFHPSMMFFAGLSCSTDVIKDILIYLRQIYGSWPRSLTEQLGNGIAFQNPAFPYSFYKKTIEFWELRYPTLVVTDDSVVYQPVFFAPAYLPQNMHFLPSFPHYDHGNLFSRRHNNFPIVSKSSSGNVPELIEKMPEVTSNIQSSVSSPDSLATTSEDVSTVRNSPSEGQQRTSRGRNNFYIDNRFLLNPQPTEEYAWRTTKKGKPLWGGTGNFYPAGFLALNRVVAEKAEKEQELPEVPRRELLS